LQKEKKAIHSKSEAPEPTSTEATYEIADLIDGLAKLNIDDKRYQVFPCYHLCPTMIPFLSKACNILI